MKDTLIGFAAFVTFLGLIVFACDRAQLAADPARDARAARQALETACAFMPTTAGKAAQDVCAAVRGTCSEGAGGSP